MARALSLTLFAAIIVLNVHSYVFPEECTKLYPSTARYVHEHQPFGVCGIVSKLNSTIQTQKLDCVVGCINRTASAVRIRMHACKEQGTAFTYPTFSDVDFVLCHSEQEIFVRGFNMSRWIEFTLIPDMSCLRNKTGSCKAILKYNRPYPMGQLYGETLDTYEEFGANPLVWKILTKNHGNLCFCGGAGFYFAISTLLFNVFYL
ncbi:hypothetical protein ZHAS_00008861 [Anopheles sinensis]|uniref:Uncharacterized protein n=1 Tax=Anopheles sinensis TaxID=74873 RepID=A0A084VTH6_ANOSI|nr:hypothetical protein ZHAS_00008861 [Anopheles sinensis]